MPITSRYTSRAADALQAGATVTASTQAWDATATRANTTVYALGNIIKLASNVGRVFVCTTAGTSAGSEPAGYASAVDGGSVTDGTAVFRAAWRQKATVTFTPAMKGVVRARANTALASSTPGGIVYFDPKLTIA